MFPTLEDGVVGMRDEVLEMGLLIRRRRNLVLPTVTCDKSHIMCDMSGSCLRMPAPEAPSQLSPWRSKVSARRTLIVLTPNRVVTQSCELDNISCAWAFLNAATAVLTHGDKIPEPE